MLVPQLGGLGERQVKRDESCGFQNSNLIGYSIMMCVFLRTYVTVGEYKRWVENI